MKNYLQFCTVILALFLGGRGFAQEDPGRAALGELEVTVYFATNGDVSVVGPGAGVVPDDIQKRLRCETKLKFSHYRGMGKDTQPIFRSYENWAQPLKPSDEILVRFETRTQPEAHSFALDLELWLARKKVLKTDALLLPDRPLFILGPKWRGGQLIVAVELASK
ncbi:hypothetical protein [Luteolibacter sp. AS25]|uniref:hypothetical protein n=1 Tax=Luteolibacter sp. AS25 TaxID=3135776 RepID=UPI00398BBC6C